MTKIINLCELALSEQAINVIVLPMTRLTHFKGLNYFKRPCHCLFGTERKRRNDSIQFRPVK